VAGVGGWLAERGEVGGEEGAGGVGPRAGTHISTWFEVPGSMSSRWRGPVGGRPRRHHLSYRAKRIAAAVRLPQVKAGSGGRRRRVRRDRGGRRLGNAVLGAPFRARAAHVVQ